MTSLPYPPRPRRTVPVPSASCAPLGTTACSSPFCSALGRVYIYFIWKSAQLRSATVSTAVKWTFRAQWLANSRSAPLYGDHITYFIITCSEPITRDDYENKFITYLVLITLTWLKSMVFQCINPTFASNLGIHKAPLFLYPFLLISSSSWAIKCSKMKAKGYKEKKFTAS